MNLRRLLDSNLGRMIISVLLGLGLATLFRKVCKDKNCITFNGPVISDVDGKTFKHDASCYKYKMEHTTCDKTKQIVDIGDKQKEPDGSLI